MSIHDFYFDLIFETNKLPHFKNVHFILEIFEN